MSLSRIALFALLATASTSAIAGSYQPIDNGVVVTPDAGAAKRVRVIAYGDDSFRVTAVPTGDFNEVPESLMVNAKPAGKPVVTQSKGSVTLKLPGASAVINLASGQVSFLDRAGKAVLTESGRSAFRPRDVEGKRWFTVSQQFNPGTDEGFYGLGQHQNGQMNYNGEDVELAQHNMAIAVPYVVSTRGYGLLWDNDGITRFGNPRPYEFVGKDLKVTSDGKPGWKAEYFLGKSRAALRQEDVIDYQYIEDQAKWPAAAKATTKASADSGQNTAGVVTQEQQVVWTGDVTADTTGEHRFQIYGSSYFKVYADGKLVMDHWRQNWNPWYHNFKLPMTAGKPVKIRIEWTPNAGYMAFLHNNPLPRKDRHSLWMTSDTGKAVDYYFVGGGTIDKSIAGYRKLTGKATLLPQWAYGFWQSRQRYETQEELLGVLREYRKREIPIDNIVQDWFYWPQDQWGSHRFDPKRFPDPKGMVDEIHALDARVMISVWPKFYPNTENAKELDRNGWLYHGNLEMKNLDWVGPGYLNTDYDAYSPGARKMYFDQIKRELVSKGFDAWWLDATEPDIHSNLSIEQRIKTMGPTAIGAAEPLFNSYPLVHVDGVAEGLREARPDVRPFILTRSGFGGLQRASAAIWSGDVAARWDNLREQISAGVNVSMSGLPNWTHDIGGFAVEDRYTNQDPAHLAEWRELNLRWFQFGAFSPLFRSHGETPFREIYLISDKDPAMQESMIWYDKLRYRLLPYIYTSAADTWFKDGSIMRGLVQDFGSDRKVWNIDDQYMFGPAFLVAPVTDFKARSRKVYLPAGSGWYDFNSGAFHTGGQEIDAAAPYERMPLFVRAGSIVPTGPAIQHTGEEPDGPIVLHVFTGADGSYSLYEDDGTSEGYRKGAFSRVAIQWNDAAHSLTIGKREGEFSGMPGKRAISVRFYDKATRQPIDFAENGKYSIVYDGNPVTITMR